ncbi:hypothetical protein V6C27_04090 [Peptococcaceae bacterium 1198_IL3148]
MSTKGAKLSFRTKTADCQYCNHRSERYIPNTDITINFCTVNLPKIVYQLRGVSISKCSYYKHKNIM